MESPNPEALRFGGKKTIERSLVGKKNFLRIDSLPAIGLQRQNRRGPPSTASGFLTVVIAPNTSGRWDCRPPFEHEVY